MRDSKGRFLKGSQGGPGRPPMEVERAYIDAATSSCSPEQWAAIVQQAVIECSDDDYRVRDKARNFVLKVLHGNSPAVVMQLANIQYQDQTEQEQDKHNGVSIYLPDNGRESKSISPETIKAIRRDVYGLDD